MSLYTLSKDMLIYLISVIQEGYKIEKMSTRELRILKTKVSKQIIQYDTKKTKELLLTDPKLYKYIDIINTIESVKFKKNSIVKIKTTKNEKAEIYKVLNSVYFFPDMNISTRHYQRYKIEDIPTNNELLNPEFLNLIFETYQLGYWNNLSK